MTKFIGAVDPHMDVMASDGQVVGKVDHEDGQDRIKLTKDQNGQHHWINWDMVERVVDAKVHLNLSAKALQDSWQRNPSAHIGSAS
jgi:hypothetical protein